MFHVEPYYARHASNMAHRSAPCHRVEGGADTCYVSASYSHSSNRCAHASHGKPRLSRPISQFNAVLCVEAINLGIT